MWSGPRNISTAMMRAWENRPDTRVVDEPFYAHFLHHTGLDHPMREEIIAHGNIDWREVLDSLVKPPDEGIFYQKHITTHWLEHYSIDWLTQLDHVFLIRKPAPVVASYAYKRQMMSASDLGYSQQATLFDVITQQQGRQPVVIDSQLFLADPNSQLAALCDRLGIAFDTAMLNWPAGVRASDGVWGAHWYDAVNRSTGFGKPRDELPVLSDAQQRIADICEPYYQAMRQFAI